MGSTPAGDLRPDWLEGAALPEPGQGKHLFTTRRVPLFYLQITKCGSTFLRNLLYRLDHDTPHEDSARIHAYPQDFLMADVVPPEIITSSPYLFAVVRDPVDRFLSLYFDKLVNLENRFDEGLRNRVAQAAGLDLSPMLNMAGHRVNCLKALDWIERNLAGQTPIRPNPHWQRQSVRLYHARGLKPRLLSLGGLNRQLTEVLLPLLPDIKMRIGDIHDRNESRKLFAREEFLTPEIEDALQRVYSEDSKIYARTQAEWGETGKEAV